MQGVGQGTLLGGRYALRQRLSQGRNLERWSAHDTTLEREVALIIVDAAHPNRAGVLDAARRAAGVEDARLVRILDVGNHPGASFIVEEAMGGSESLATILPHGPLPAEEARRIAGETAKALDTAGQRGLHHLRLNPDRIMVAPDGTVRVSGVAVAAAIDGPDEHEPDPATASRRDAVCLVAVAYAALTGRWPLAEKVPGLEPAPRMVDGVAAPSEIAAGVPGDLSALCRTTLNEGAGPLTPGDFARQIAPWSREQVHRDGAEATAVLQLPTWGDGGDGEENAPASASGTEPTVALSSHDLTTRQGSTGSPDEPLHQDDDLVPISGPTSGEASVSQTGHVSESTPRDVSESTPGDVSESTPGDVSESTTRETSLRSDPNPERGTPGLPKGLLGQDESLGPPLPMLPASTAFAPSRGQTRIVVLTVATFVALSLFAGYCGLRDLNLGNGMTGTNASSPTGQVTVSPSQPATATPTSAQPTETASAGPIAILSATGFDPEGDDSEKNSQAPRVYDDDNSTTWTSEGYFSAQFGGLKDGVGVILDLGQPTSVGQVTLELGGGPADLTVYAATESSIEGATAIGSASAASGQVQIEATSTMPKAQYVIVWFTSLPPDGDQFRASIAEIALG